MLFVSRKEWGARAPKSVSTNIDPQGVALHWEGPQMGLFPHSECAGKVRGIQRFHMDTKGWADIAYSGIVCPHGFVFEGRWLNHRTASQGTEFGNDHYYSLCYLGGQKDPFTPLAKQGFNEGIFALGGGKVLPHSAFHSTECPGLEIKQWITQGRPSSLTVEEIKMAHPEVAVTSAIRHIEFSHSPEGKVTGYIIILDNGAFYGFGSEWDAYRGRVIVQP